MSKVIHFHRLGTKSASWVECQGRSTAKIQNTDASLVIAFTFHPAVGNFACCGEMGF